MSDANSYRDQLINALLTFAGPQTIYADLPDEVRRVCKQAADALCGPDDAADAKRYRYLRERGDMAPIYVPAKLPEIGNCMVLATGEQLDAALDEAIRNATPQLSEGGK